MARLDRLTPVFFLVLLLLAVLTVSTVLAEESPDAAGWALRNQAVKMWDPWDATTDEPAKALLQRVIAEYPQTEAAAKATLDLAVYEWKKGRKDQALAIVKQLEEKYPNSLALAEAWFYLAQYVTPCEGDCAAALGLLAKARERLGTDTLRLWVDLHEATLREKRLGDVRGAIRLCHQTAQVFRAKTESLLAWGRIMRLCAKFAGQQLIPKQMDWLGDTPPLPIGDEDRTAAVVALADCRRDPQFPLSLEELRRLIEDMVARYPNSVWKSRLLYESALARAKTEGMTGQYPVVEQIARDFPNDNGGACAHALLANRLAAIGRLDEAVPHYSAAADNRAMLAEWRAECCGRMAFFAMRAGRKDIAEKALDRAGDIAPGTAEHWQVIEYVRHWSQKGDAQQ